MSEPTLCPRCGPMGVIGGRALCPRCPASDFSVPPEEAQERDGTLFDPIDLDIPKPRNPYREDDAA